MKERSPENSHFDRAVGRTVPSQECHLVSREAGRRPALDGNVARRRDTSAGIIWDPDLVGFGLRVRDTGYKSWIVKYRERHTQRFVTLGNAAKLDAPTARAKALVLLERAALDGLPTRQKTKVAPSFANYIDEFWRDYAHHWKPSTRVRNRSLLKLELIGYFGDLPVDSIRRADVMRWRDDLGTRPATFNRALPMLAVMLRYAEQLGYRRKGSNPCKGMPRYKRELPGRYLSPAEYQRLARTLDQFEVQEPSVVAAIRLIMFTGARQGEIATLRWEHVQPPRLMLPDSKTGAKIIWLNRPAFDVLDALPEQRATGFVFRSKQSPDRPIALNVPWTRIRRHAALPDVRLHDLRHSFASVAIADGVPLSIIGKLLGHALPETTARYAHLADGVIAEAAERVSGGLAVALGLVE